MKSLLLVAHGSRRTQSNEEIAEITKLLRARLSDRYQAVEYAFLELAEPSIPNAIDQLASKGYEEVLILPYFLSAGRHVHEDVPEIIESKQQQYSHINIMISPYLGESEKIIDLLEALSLQN